MPWGLASLEDTGRKECQHKLGVEVWDGPAHRQGRTATVKNEGGGQVQGQSPGLPGRGQLPRDILKDNVPSELTLPLLPRLATRATIKSQT